MGTNIYLILSKPAYEQSEEYFDNEQVEKLSEIFKKVDKNHDGALSIE